MICEQCRATMFLRQKIRKKDGKRHRYFSVVENQRVAGGGGRSEACSSPRRDQRFAGIGVAPVDRGVGRRGRSAQDAGAVSRRPLRRDFAGRLDRSAEAVAIAAASGGAVGRVLAGAFAVGGVATRRSGRTAKARIGIRSFSCWSPIVCWRRAANGDCIGVV